MESPHSVYRQIRAERTWRPLGKMSWWRIVLGLALLLLVFLISGFVSQQLAAAGHFKAADALMIAPGWMEKYKPEVKAFIEAGVLYQDGDYASAVTAFGDIESLDAARSMKSLSALKLAEALLQSGEVKAAEAALSDVDRDMLPPAYEKDLLDVISQVRTAS